MKKLIMLISLLLVSYLSFSQNATTIPADTIVPLKVPIAKLVIKDLIKGDGAIEELKETQKILKLTQDKIVIKDTIISNLNTKISNLDFIIGEKDKQFSLERQKSTELYKELKQQKRTTFLYKVGTFVGLLFTGVLLVN